MSPDQPTLHVCMVNPFVTQIVGGVQRQLYLQSRALVERGVGVSVLQRRDGDWTPAKAAQWGHVRMLEVPEGPRALGVRGRGLLFLAGGLRHLARHRRSISLVHAHQLSSPALLAVLARTLFGIPVVAKVTASGSWGEMAELGSLPLARLRRRFLRSIDRILVLTEGMREEVVASLGLSPDRVAILPNCVQAPDVFPERSFPRDGPFALLYTGRLSEEKSLETLIEAAGLLVERGLGPVEVHLVGPVFAPRDPMPRLRAAMAALDPRARVLLHGHQEDLAPFYRRADAFVLPSQSEGMSNALLEAMAAGTCCVVSDIPENRALIDDGEQGLLFVQGDARSLAGRLASLHEDQRGRAGERSSRLARAAHARVRATYSVDAVTRALVGIYEESRRAR